jgi:Cu2+-containing amine oxidase
VSSNGALPEGQKPAHGTLVAPQVYGPNHQHIFCLRLDMMVDGAQNTVYGCDSVALPPGPENPYGNAWVVRQTPLRRETEAKWVVPDRQDYGEVDALSLRRVVNAVGFDVPRTRTDRVWLDIRDDARARRATPPAARPRRSR